MSHLHAYTFPFLLGSSIHFQLPHGVLGCAHSCFVPHFLRLSQLYWSQWKNLVHKNPNLLLFLKPPFHRLPPLHLQPLRQLLQKNLNCFDNSEHHHPELPLHQRRLKQKKDGVISSRHCQPRTSSCQTWTTAYSKNDKLQNRPGLTSLPSISPLLTLYILILNKAPTKSWIWQRRDLSRTFNP